LAAVCWAGHENILRLLEKDFPFLDASRGLENSVIQGNIDISKLLLGQNSWEISFEAKYFAGKLACERGHLELVKILVKSHNIDPTAENNEYLFISSRNGHSNIVKYLLKLENINPDARDPSAIFLATKEGHVEVVRLFLADKRINLKSMERSLVEAIKQGETDIANQIMTDPRILPDNITGLSQALVTAKKRNYKQLLDDLTSTGKIKTLLHQI